jgi:hypothetical protein
MRTPSETVTSSIEADASPDLVLQFLSDPRGFRNGLQVLPTG